MSEIYLYEFQYLNAPVQRLKDGSGDIEIDGETWYGVNNIDDLDETIKIVDNRPSGNFRTWLSDNSISKLYVTEYVYDTEEQTKTKIIKLFCIEVSVSVESVSLKIDILHEFNYSRSQIRRIKEENTIQADTYTWDYVYDISESDLFLTVIDKRIGNNNFVTWISNNSIGNLMLLKYRYDVESFDTTLISKNLYINVSIDLDDKGNRITFRRALPEAQLDDAQKLIADGIVQLYEITLADNTVIHLKQDNSVTWNGENWLGIPILFEGYSSAQGNSYARPTLSIANPDIVNTSTDNAYSTYSSMTQPQTVIKKKGQIKTILGIGTNKFEDEDVEVLAYYPYGLLDRAVVNRYLVLYDDLINDRPIYQKKTWIIWFVKTVNKTVIQVELRNPMDGVNFDVPARMYIPPEFPFVTLG